MPPASRPRLDHFHGVRFGTPRDQAIARLTEFARSLGDDPRLTDHGEPLSGGGSVYLEGATWTIGFSYDLYDTVVSRIGMWRHHPAGREASFAWIAASIDAYGPPDGIALLAPTDTRTLDLLLEWSDPSGCTEVTLLCHGEQWDAREDRTAYPRQRSGHIHIAHYRAQLGQLRARLTRIPAQPGPLAAQLRRTEDWLRAREDALAALESRLPGIGVVDVFDALAGATRTLDAIDRGLPDCDGAFLVIRPAAGADLNELHDRLWRLAQATGVRLTQVAVRPSHDREPTTREPLPPPPDDTIQWAHGPLAASLLRDELQRFADLAAHCELVPARRVTVDGAVEEWLRIPPPADDIGSTKYALSSKRLHPLRLTHPDSGVSVYLNHGDSRDDVRRHAHALLAARLKSRP